MDTEIESTRFDFINLVFVYSIALYLFIPVCVASVDSELSYVTIIMIQNHYFFFVRMKIPIECQKEYKKVKR